MARTMDDAARQRIVAAEMKRALERQDPGRYFSSCRDSYEDPVDPHLYEMGKADIILTSRDKGRKNPLR